MTFPIILGSALVALGLISLMTAWLHPNPQTTTLVKAIAWPRKTQDRIGIALASVMFIAIGALFFFDAPADGWIPALVCGVVIMVVAFTLGLREPAV